MCTSIHVYLGSAAKRPQESNAARPTESLRGSAVTILTRLPPLVGLPYWLVSSVVIHVIRAAFNGGKHGTVHSAVDACTLHVQ